MMARTKAWNKRDALKLTLDFFNPISRRPCAFQERETASQATGEKQKPLQRELGVKLSWPARECNLIGSSTNFKFKILGMGTKAPKREAPCPVEMNPAKEANVAGKPSLDRRQELRTSPNHSCLKKNSKKAMIPTPRGFQQE
ncbi:hypothetical protein BSKO_12444 [Bryopsis sp. KO-2023]|nr:hypothetical protein BSKO_12444 [Bryopsis sp. KO-2023]